MQNVQEVHTSVKPPSGPDTGPPVWYMLELEEARQKRVTYRLLGRRFSIDVRGRRRLPPLQVRLARRRILAAHVRQQLRPAKAYSGALWQRRPAVSARSSRRPCRVASRSAATRRACAAGGGGGDGPGEPPPQPSSLHALRGTWRADALALLVALAGGVVAEGEVRHG